jgi:hypothetical protein
VLSPVNTQLTKGENEMRDVLSRLTRIALVSLAAMTVAAAWTSIAAAATPGSGSVGPAPAPPFQTWAGETYLPPGDIFQVCPSGGLIGGDPTNTICDHYRLTVTGAGPVQVRIDWADPMNDFDLFVYRCPSADPTVNCDDLVAESVSPGGTTNFESLSFPAVAATYEVRADPTFIVTPSDYRGCAAFLARATCTSAGGMVNSGGIDPPISISNARVTEGDSGTRNATFAVALGWATVTPVTVNYVTLDRTASAGSDYVPSTGTVVIPAGQTSATINVPVVGDVANEADEVFEVDLKLPAPPAVVAKIKDGQGFATIVDDDWRRAVSGAGKVGVLTQGTFSLWVAENRSGKVSYKDASSRFYATRITSAAFTDATHSAKVDGGGYNNGHSVTFTLEVGDNGAGTLDAFVLTLSDGTRITGPLVSGDIGYTG